MRVLAIAFYIAIAALGASFYGASMVSHGCVDGWPLHEICGSR